MVQKTQRLKQKQKRKEVYCRQNRGKGNSEGKGKRGHKRTQMTQQVNQSNKLANLSLKVKFQNTFALFQSLNLFTLLFLYREMLKIIVFFFNGR